MLVAYPPGGSSDTMGRLVAENLAKAVGNTVVVENRPGAGGRIGSRVCKAASNDGYTLCMVSPAQAIAPLVTKDAAYDANDFTYIAQVAKVPNLLLVHPSLPVTTLRDFIAFAKARPATLSYASSGGGASPELAMELLKQQAKIDIMQITYKGSGSAIIDQVAGRIEVAFTPSVGIIGFVTSGKLRTIAVSTLERFPLFPKVPTLDESGLKGFEASSWQGVVAPAGLAPALVGYLNREIVTFMRTPAMHEKILGIGGMVAATSAEDFDALFRSEGKKWSTVATKAGLSIN